jgi:zinc D-Ala-D-Ala carboxypeptidase
MRLSPNFTLAELTVTSTGLPNVPSQSQIEALRALATHVLQPIRDALGRAVVVTSAFRAPAVNRAVGGSSTSDHVNGSAADIRTSGMDSRQLAEFVHGLGLPIDQLIVYPGTQRIHVSYRKNPRRQLLTAVKQGSRTVYQPGFR